MTSVPWEVEGMGKAMGMGMGMGTGIVDLGGWRQVAEEARLMAVRTMVKAIVMDSR